MTHPPAPVPEAAGAVEEAERVTREILGDGRPSKLWSDTVERIATALAAKDAEIERLRGEQHMLATDKAAVRVNLLRGTLAKPDDLVFMHDTDGPVAQAIATAVAAETERCAKVAEQHGEIARELHEKAKRERSDRLADNHEGGADVAEEIAAAIRAPAGGRQEEGGER